MPLISASRRHISSYDGKFIFKKLLTSNAATDKSGSKNTDLVEGLRNIDCAWCAEANQAARKSWKYLSNVFFYHGNSHTSFEIEFNQKFSATQSMSR